MPTHRQQTLEKLVREMLATFDKLGDDPMARIDARVWHKYYTRKFKKLK